jgi:ferredoxin-NADP reductase
MADLSPQLWQQATITAIFDESSRTKTFRLTTSQPMPFIAGQHFSIQLRAANGYATARDFSFSSAPSSGDIDVTIVHLPRGEVSSWFHELAEVGDSLEVSPPIGYYFNWSPQQTEPVLLIAGGVGVTPLVSILREHKLTQAGSPIALFYSVRDFDEICFKPELVDAENVTFTFTGTPPDEWQGNTGRVTADMLQPLLRPDQTIYICGPTSFVEAVDAILVEQLGINSTKIRNERFG